MATMPCETRFAVSPIYLFPLPIPTAILIRNSNHSCCRKAQNCGCNASKSVRGLPLKPELAGACSLQPQSGKRRSGQSSRSSCRRRCCGCGFCGCADYAWMLLEGVCWTLASSFHLWEKVWPNVELNIACGPMPKPQQFSPMTRQHVCAYLFMRKQKEGPVLRKKTRRIWSG